MKKLKAILCYIRGYHKYSYYTDECIGCGKISFREIKKDNEQMTSQ